MKRPSTLQPLRHTVFRNVWIANLASSLGTLVQAVGAAWLMTLITQSANMVALVQASTALPIMLFSIASGAIADNFDRRKVMLLAQLLMFAVSLLLVLVAYSDMMTPWLLLAFTFLLGCGAALHNPSWQASVGDMVPREDLPAAVALNGLGFNLVRSVGPAIGGAIVAAAGATAAFAVNASSYLALIFALWRWKPPVVDNSLPRESLGLAMQAGLRYAAMSPSIEKVYLRGFIFGFSVIAIVALLPLVARDLLSGGAFLFGILFGCFGVGAVGGALGSGVTRRHLSAEWITRFNFLGFAVCALVTAASSNAWLTGAALMLGGACWVQAFSLFNITVQLMTPRWVVGRMLAFHQMATFGGMALGSWVWGMTADGFGPQTALRLATIVMLFGASLGLVRKLAVPELASLNLDPLNRWKMPRLELDIAPRSGPIRIMIEYEIKLENTPEFLQAMAERRRIRKRDGARKWSLARDMEHFERWVETYYLPTWLEYIRYNQRMTQHDALVGDQIRRLHSGAEPPRVHRLIERPTGRRVTDAQPKGMIDLH